MYPNCHKLIIAVLLSAICHSARATSIAEAETAYREGMADLAQSRYTAVFQSEDASELDRFTALVRIARILVENGDATAAGALLDQHLPMLPPKELRVEATLLRSDILLANGRVMRAMSELDLLDEKDLTQEESIMLKRLRARGLIVLDREAEAVAIYRGMNTNLAEGVLAGLRLDWSRLAEKHHDGDLARKLLAKAAAADLKLPDVQQAVLRLAELDLEDGNPSNTVTRLEVFQNDVELAKVLKPVAQELLADALEKLGRVEEALAALQGLEHHKSSATDLARLRVRQAGLRIEQGQLTNATAVLRTQIAVLGDDPQAARVQEKLADARLAAGDFMGAAQSFQDWLDVFSNEDARIRVQLGKAWALEGLKEWEAAARMYEKVATTEQEAGRVRGEALLKWADMEFLSGLYAEARERYQSFLSAFPNDDGAARASFQSALCLARIEKPAASVLEELDRVRRKFPDSPYAERSVLEKAGVMNRALRLEQALGLYDAYLDQYPQGTFVSDALMDKGMVAYRLGLYDLALRLFDRVWNDFSDSSRAEQAFFMRGWAMYMRGKEGDALAINRAFLESFPDSRWAADVRFWIAEHAFNRSNFKEAEDGFVELAETLEDKESKARAYYLAGRSALARKDQERAVGLLTLAIDAAPDSPKVADRLFYKGDALTELNRFDAAIVVFDSLIERFPDSWLVHAAWGRKGDCQFTLGEADEERFGEALASYRTVAESAKADAGLKLQAVYKLGRTLAATGKEDEALVQYKESVLMYLEERERLGQDAEAWFVRAATDAALVYEKRGNWRNALSMYEKLVDAGVPQAAEAQKRIFRLRRDHFLLF